MADIKVSCTDCDATLTVSEYVDVDALKCRACGAKMVKPAGTGESAKPPAVRLAAPKPADPPAPTAVNPESLERNRSVRRFFPGRLNKPSKRKKSRRDQPKSIVRYWLLFAVLAGVASLIRWGGLFDDQTTMDIIVPGALVFFGILHIAILTEAFREDIFQGVLCLFIPFYSVYYLLTQTDNYVVRCLGAGMLIGFGIDLTEFIINAAIDTYHFIENWIMTVN